MSADVDTSGMMNGYLGRNGQRARRGRRQKVYILLRKKRIAKDIANDMSREYERKTRR